MVFARDETNATESGYGLETELADPDARVIDAAADGAIALEALARPLTVLGQRLEAMIADPPDWLDGSARARVEGATASLSWRIDTVRAWISMLARAVGPVDPEYVDWLAGVDFVVPNTPLTVGVAYVDTDITRAESAYLQPSFSKGQDGFGSIADAQVVFSVTAAF